MSGAGPQNSDWNPETYARFRGLRLRPALDLLMQVGGLPDGTLVDLGCGDGAAAGALKSRYPKHRLVGVDASPAMLAKAKGYAALFEADVERWTPPEAPALIFSNAALQWLPGHDALLPRLAGLLAPGGVLAVQMPAMHKEPLRTLPLKIGATPAWVAHLRGKTSARDLLEPGEYWDILRPRVAELDMWETIYMHALQGENAVGEWAQGSSLRPFLDALPEHLRAPFRAAYDAEANKIYPRRADGVTLLPFRRQFFVASV